MTGTTFTGVLHLEQNLNAVNPSYGRVNFVTVSKSFSYPLPKICLIKPPKFNTSTSKALRVFKTRQVPRRAISTADSQTSDGSHQQPYSNELQAALSAVEKACELCVLVKSKNKETTNSFEKGDKSPVTIADFGVQALISIYLKEKFPEIPLLGEEDSKILKTSPDYNSPEPLNKTPNKALNPEKNSLAGEISSLISGLISSQNLGEIDEKRVISALDSKNFLSRAAKDCPEKYWVLDPIDGTRGFLRGGDCQYTVGLALIERGEIVVGVLGLPNFPLFSPRFPPDFPPDSPPKRGVLIGASLGNGAFFQPLSDSRNGKFWLSGTRNGKLNSRKETENEKKSEEFQPTVCISDHEIWKSLPLSKSWKDLKVSGKFEKPQILALCCGSLCKYAAVSLGFAEIFIQHPVSSPDLKVWDHAAGVICVTEAGGNVTDFGGVELELGHGKSDFQPFGGGVVVTKGVDHSEIIRALNAL